jgi:Tol biopolymer transport system component/phosphohistidine phosphatase SixA
MRKIIQFVLLVVLGLAPEIAKADFTFGVPTNLGPAVNSSHDEYDPSISADGLSLYFMTVYPLGGSGSSDLYVARRETTDDDWGTVVNLGPIVNSSADEYGPDISYDGLSLYFNVWNSGDVDVLVTTRAQVSDPWGPPVNLGSPVNTSANESHPHISNDGLSLYFSDWGMQVKYRTGGMGREDLWIATRASVSDPWGSPVNLGRPVNTTYRDDSPDTSADGLVLLVASNRPGGFGDLDIWMSRRTTMKDDWGLPMNLGSIVNGPAREEGQTISVDGKTLYFHSNRSGGVGGYDLWQAPIIPITDLNDDGIVDAVDMCILVDHWGMDNQLCDIGPMPWGDGIVDVEDLKVLAEHLFEEPPQRPQVTTVVIVRHAERANGTLTEEGEKRAETLACLLSNVGLSAIFSTNYERTIETANNTAERLSIPIQFYTSVEAVTDLIKSEYAGKVLLVVGHSNTVTQTVQALGVSSVPQFDGRYDNLYIVTIHPDGTTLLTHLRFDIYPDL